jgi:COP9 signalosome complex subunit 4
MKAALRYYELSQIVGEQERLEALQYAVICAILAPAGPQRSRILATLYKDERSSKIELASILEKMYVRYSCSLFVVAGPFFYCFVM